MAVTDTPLMSVIDPARFARWLEHDPDAAVALYAWARALTDSPAFPVLPWPGFRTGINHHTCWVIKSVTWDEGLLIIEAFRSRLRPTLERPTLHHTWTWTGRDAHIPPAWPWDIP